MRVRRALGAVSLVALAALSLGRHTKVHGQTVGAFNPQRVFSDEPAYPLDVSPDGRYAVVVTQFSGRGTDENPSRLLLRDRLTNTMTPLAAGSSSFGPGGRPAGVFSPDGTQVAFGWTDRWVPGMPLAQVRTVMRVRSIASGGTPRTLVDPDPAGGGTVPHGWSPDGKSILVLLHGPGASVADPTVIAWLSVADRAVRRIKTLEPWRNGDNALPRLSPDGGSIAYSVVARQGSTDRHVFVIDADGRNERAVATLAGSNTMPVWTPDGAHVVFVNVNTPSGRRDLYLAPVGEGGRATEPVRLRTDFVGEPLRISRSGDLFYHQSDDGFDQMIAERRDGSARIVQVFPGMGGSWSKSGDKLAFLRLGLDSRAELVIRSLETGRERSYLHAGIQLMPPRWLSDDSAVIVQIGPNGDGGRPGGSFYRVDIQTGDFKWLFARDAPGYVRSFVGVVSPDDKTFYLFARVNAQAPWTRIVGVDLATGVERAVVTLPEPGISDTRGLAISPDGSTLAIYASDGRIMTVRTDGRDLHELRVPLSSRSSLDAMKWTPDGRAIVVAAGNSLASFGWHMRQISTVGDQAQIDGLDSSRLDSTVSLPRKEIGGVTSIDLSPDGSRIALASRADRTIGIWMLAKVGSPQQRAR